MPTKNLQLQLISQNNAQAPAILNKNSIRIDTGANFFVVVDSTVAGTAAVSTLGNAYIVPSGGNNGPWSTFATGDIAFYDGNNWFRITPVEGQFAYDQQTDQEKFFNGSAWTNVASNATTILALTDVNEADFVGHAGQVLAVNSGETAMEFVANSSSGSTTFAGLTDTPANFTGQGGKFLKVNSGETALEFTDETGSFVGLSDTPSVVTGGKFLKGNTATNPDTIQFASPSISELEEASTGLTVPTNVNQFLKANASGELVFGQPSALQLSDTPSSFSGQAGKVLKVNSGETALEFATDATAGSGSSTFVGLSDTPANFIGASFKMLRVNSVTTAIEFVTPSFLLNTDTPSSFASNGNAIVKVNNGATALEFGATSLNLSDTPSTYGSAGQVLKVNAAANGLEFGTAGGSGAATTWNDLTDCEDFAAGAQNKRLVTNQNIPPTGIVFEPNTLIGMDDTPANFTGAATKLVRVNSSGNAIEFQAPDQCGISFLDLTDAPASFVADKFLKVNGAGNAILLADGTGGTGSSTFAGLSDTPANFTGSAYKYLRVNAGNGTTGTAVEFVDHVEIKDIYIQFPFNAVHHVILSIPYAYKVVELKGRISTPVAGTIQLQSAANESANRSLNNLMTAQTLVTSDTLKTFTLNSTADSVASGRGLSVVTSGYPQNARDLQLMVKIRRL